MTTEAINKAAEYAEKAFPIIHGNKLCDEKIYSLNEMHKYAREAIVEFVKKAGAAFTQPDWRYVERDGLPTFTGTYQISFEVQGLLGSSGTDVQEADFNAQLNEWLNWPEEFKIYAWRFIKPPPLKP